MNPDRPPSSRYCDFHEDYGHTTERCIQLSNLIEKKIQSGQLVHFIDHSPSQKNLVSDSDRVIDVISGGIAVGGASNNSKKQYAREVYQIHPGVAKKPKPSSHVISFSEADRSPGLLDDHQDPLVITTKIGTNTVKKILIDT